MIKLFTRNVKMFFRNIIITFSIKLYLIFKFTIILDIVSYFGGPVFVKLFQSFFNLRHVNNDNDMEGTIGSIHFNNDLVTTQSPCFAARQIGTVFGSYLNILALSICPLTVAICNAV